MNNTIIFGTIAGFMTCGALIMLALIAHENKDNIAGWDHAIRNWWRSRKGE
jgi:hypothetical protein